MKLLSALFVPALLVLSSCASTRMQVATQQGLVPAVPGKAQIVFLRSSSAGSAFQSSVYDVTSGNPFFIGIVANNTRVSHLTDPGKRTFMVVSEAADFMQAELSEGRTYYSIVTPQTGAWKAHFSLHPIKKDPAGKFSTASPDFAGWLANTRLVENTPESEQWARDNNKDVQEKYHEYWPKWLGKTAEEKEQLTLRPEDGE
jgi:hypothetical protein